jgi:hypothetical protein
MAVIKPCDTLACRPLLGKLLVKFTKLIALHYLNQKRLANNAYNGFTRLILNIVVLCKAHLNGDIIIDTA